MMGLEGKGDYSERGKRKTQSETGREKNPKKKQRDTRSPNDVRQQTSVTCVEYLLSTRGLS